MVWRKVFGKNCLNDVRALNFRCIEEHLGVVTNMQCLLCKEVQ